MSSENSKPGSKPGSNGPAESPHDPDGTSKSTGRVKFDDRGNAIWEWQVTTGAFSPEVSTQRLQRLEHPALSIADDAPTPFETVRSNPLGTKKGYDPYDSGKLGKTPAPPRKKDLRKLSEWLKLKKQADDNKDEDGSTE
jgi:hypothetical protein